MDFDCLASMVAVHKLYPDFIPLLPSSIERHVRDFITKEGLPCPYIIMNKLTEPVTECIIVDNTDLSRTELPVAMLTTCIVTAIYDHHPPENIPEKTTYFQKQCGATITLLTELLLKKKIPISQQEAVLFLLGIYEDTGYFTFISLTVDDVAIFNKLFPIAGDVTYISRYLVTDFSKEQLSIMDDLVDNGDILDINGISVAVCHAERDGYVDNAAFAVQHLLFVLEVDAVFAVMQMGKSVYIIGRSRNKALSIRDILGQIGGGGHPSAGYVHISDVSFVEIKEKMYDILEQVRLTGKTVSDIMTTDVVAVRFDETVAQVKEKMLAHNHSKLPVVDKEHRVFGLMYQKEIDRLINHNFSDVPIHDYVVHDVAVCEETEPVYSAKRLILEGRGVILAVTSAHVLSGIITRTDLMKTEENTASGQQRKNILSELRYHVPGPLLERIERIGAIADSLGYRAYLVGGFVRDLFLRLETFDVDIVIEGKGIETAQVAAEEFSASLTVHKKFQTATLCFRDGVKIDIATARSETYDKPAALPVVMLSPLKYDLYRRDFTINAMAVSICPDSMGDLIDYFGGYGDLKNKTLKILHTVSFIEDPTRIFRGIRFAARFDFHFSKQTHGLMKNALSLGVLSLLTGRRIKDEISVICDEDYPEYAFQMLGEENILKSLFTGCTFPPEKEKLFREIRHVLHWYKLLYLKKTVNNYFLYYLALFDDADTHAVLDYAQKLELTKRFKNIAQEVRLFMQQRYRMINKPGFLKKSEIYDLFNKLELESILYLMACHAKNERFQQYASLYFMDIYPKKSIVNGTMLQEIGIPYGADIRTILEDIHKQYVDGDVRTVEDAVSYVKRIYLTEQK